MKRIASMILGLCLAAAPLARAEQWSKNFTLTGKPDLRVTTSDANIRVVRGGGWSEPARGCRSANRGNYSPDVRAGYFGFRVVLAPGQP